jgi:hypothetical protein
VAYNIPNIRQGDEYIVRIDTIEAFDFTGYKAQLTLRVHPEAFSPSLVQSSTAGDVVTDDPTKGIMHIVVPSAVTAAVEPGTYCYDIRLKRPGPEGDGIKTLIPTVEVPVAWFEVLPQIARSIV